MAKMFIHGESVNAVSGKVLDVLSPVDGKKFDDIPRGDKADVDLAVQAARQALDGAWGKMSALERGRLLMKLGEKAPRHVSGRGTRAVRRRVRTRATPRATPRQRRRDDGTRSRAHQNAIPRHLGSRGARAIRQRAAM